MMHLHKLIPSSWLDEDFSNDLMVEEITADSRQVKPGMLFIAVVGFNVDGRNYIQQAIKAGAVAVLYEAKRLSKAQQNKIVAIKKDSTGIPMVAVEGLDEKIGYIAAEFFGNPSQSMRVLGLTGTNGKTSCAYLLAQSLQLLGFKSAFIGTVGWGDISCLQTATHTTPDAVSLQRQLATLLDQKYTHVCIEVSSHALEQGRVNGVEFYGAMFTNFSQDHLDFHKTMESYAAAKRRLFTEFELKFLVTNSDDELGSELLNISHTEFIASYGKAGDVSCEDVITSQTGIALTIESESLNFDIQTLLVGLVNVPNILLIVTTLLVLNVEVSDIQKVMKKLQPVVGRMEIFGTDKTPVVVVDYAHTPDALKRALISCREHCLGKLWIVFGCGGDRDQEKRAKMGMIAEQNADQVVITSDNSRSEKSHDIFTAIQQGMTMTATQIEDRATAIEWTISKADIEDWILVAGKGHETTQTIGDVVTQFSDRHWVEQCLEVAA